MEPRAPATGFIASLRDLGAGVFASVLRRLELFSIELQEEKLRLIQTFVWISAAAPRPTQRDHEPPSMNPSASIPGFGFVCPPFDRC